MSLVDKIREWYKPNKVKSSFEILSVATGHKFDWLKKEVLLNGVKVEFILDSGAQISCINEHTWEKVGSPVLTKVNFSGKSYTGDEFAILGNFVSKVELNGVEENLLVYVTKEKMNLFGLPWIVNFEKRLGYPIVTSILQNEIKSMVKNNELVYVVESNSPEIQTELKNKFSRVFEEGLGHCRLNEALELNKYPLPTPQEIWAEMHGNKVFSQLDLRDAYLQIELDDESKKLANINTHRGLFEVQRLPFGVKSAPAIFQKLMDELISGLNGVFAYLDDLIIVSKNEREHKEVLFELFERIENYGLKIQLEKCNFFKSELKFLGHIVSKEGIKPDPEKKSIIQKLQRPKDGNARVRGPLDKLLQKNIEWKWEDEQETSFEKIKSILSSDLLLTHFDPQFEIIVTADASNYGVGAMISHKFPDGSEKAIEYASKSLSQSEKNYGQIEKEGLALVFAVQKFHKMLFGRKFKLRTDHKPLVSIFGNKKGIKVQTASRLQRWALILTNYDFDIEFIRIIALVEFDSGPPDEINQVEDTVKHVLNIMLEELPVDNKQIRIETENDQILKKVKEYICNGWPKQSFTNTTTSAKDSIKNLEWAFSHYGFPKTIVSDNGSPFQSYEFKNYCKSKGINQVYSPPYHPQSNGQVERFVDYFKRMMKKNWGKSNWLQEVLLNYRATPHESLNGKSPAEEFLNKKLRIELSLVKPEKSTNSINNRREEIREKMKSWFDNHHGAKSRKYEIGDKVLFSNYSKNKNTEWLVGKIVNRNGVVYKIQSDKLRAIISRHINQLRNCKYNENQQSVNSWWKNRQNNIQINSPKINSPNERQIIRVDNSPSPMTYSKRIIRPTKRLVVENTKSQSYREEPIKYLNNWINQRKNTVEEYAKDNRSSSVVERMKMSQMMLL
uniref:RNA-directed DNA polymerase n=1 Tax=Meloidogyne hapla TaxID=6305 RepID=A0A1I8BLI1_MELHA